MAVSVDGKKFRCALPRVGADLVEAEIGGAGASFQPYFAMYRWLRQKKLGIQFEVPKATIKSLENGALTADCGSYYGLRIYDLAPGFGGQNELGGIEAMLVLKRKPPTNKFLMNLPDMSGMVLHYQPPLTEEFMAGRDGFTSVTETYAYRENGGFLHRPENVVGSYAIYDPTIRRVYTDRAEAALKQIGKLFHVYRPLATDARGNKSWGNLTYTAGQFVTEIDQSWLKTATYPVVIDPNFGWETLSASEASIEDGKTGTMAMGVIGTGVSIFAGNDRGSADGASKCALYDTSGNLITNGTTAEKTGTYEKNWQEFEFSSAPTLAAQNYVMLIMGKSTDGTNYAYWESEAGWRDYVASGGAYEDGWPDPLDLTYYNNTAVSIYCVYTTGSLPVVEYPLMEVVGSKEYPRILKTDTGEYPLIYRVS